MLQPPSESINIDSAFERACASTQVEPNYSENAPEGECWKPLAKWPGKIKVNEHKRSNDIALVAFFWQRRRRLRDGDGSPARPQNKVAVMWGGNRCLPWIKGPGMRNGATCGKGWVSASDTHSEIFRERVSRCYPAPKLLISPLNCAFAWGITMNIPLSLSGYLWPFECKQIVSWSLSREARGRENILCSCCSSYFVVTPLWFVI